MIKATKYPRREQDESTDTRLVRDVGGRGKRNPKALDSYQ